MMFVRFHNVLALKTLKLRVKITHWVLYMYIQHRHVKQWNIVAPIAPFPFTLMTKPNDETATFYNNIPFV